MKYQLVVKETNEIVTPHYVGLAPNGELYIDGMNVTDRYHIRMFTGLKDKNQKEIYEGDIVLFEDVYDTSTEGGYSSEDFPNRGIIFYDEKHARFDVTNKEGLDYDDLFESGIDFEIVGNKYETPELIPA